MLFALVGDFLIAVAEPVLLIEKLRCPEIARQTVASRCIERRDTKTVSTASAHRRTVWYRD